MTVPETTLHELAALAGVVLAHDDLTSALTEVCQIAARAVPRAHGSSLTMVEDGIPAAAAFSHEWAKSLDELQYREHEGPCLDATRTGQLFRVRDLTNEPRWPTYAPVAAETGARSVLSIPVAVEAKVMGALNIYSTEVDAFTSETVSLAEVIGAHASLATAVATALYQHQGLSKRLQGALVSMPVVEQAKGILMSQRRITAAEAFDALRELSQHRNVKLRLIAQQVVDTGELPD